MKTQQPITSAMATSCWLSNRRSLETPLNSLKLFPSETFDLVRPLVSVNVSGYYGTQRLAITEYVSGLAVQRSRLVLLPRRRRGRRGATHPATLGSPAATRHRPQPQREDP